jgi:pterin-4a-carbinolamine dehydratase
MKVQNQEQPNESLKAERVQRADGSADAARPLKAERVQRTVKGDQDGKPDTPETIPGSPGPAPSADVALRLQRLSGWSVDAQGALHKTFTSTDSTGARYFAEAIHQATVDLHRPPEIQRQDRRVQVTVPSPPEGLTETAFTLAAAIEDRWDED